jgi:hypothetical protein
MSSPTRAATENPAVMSSSRILGGGQRVQSQEPRAGQQGHRHQEGPVVVAAGGCLAGDQAERHVHAGHGEHQPEVRRMVLPAPVDIWFRGQQRQRGQRQREHRDPKPQPSAHGWLLPGSAPLVKDTVRHLAGTGRQAGPASASIVAVGTIPSTWRTSSVSRVTNASACSWVSAMYSAT